MARKCRTFTTSALILLVMLMVLNVCLFLKLPSTSYLQHDRIRMPFSNHGQRRRENKMIGGQDSPQDEKQLQSNNEQRNLDEQKSGEKPDEECRGRSSFSDPGVTSFVAMLKEKGLMDLPPGGAMHDEEYWAFLKRQRLRRRAGMQLPAYRNYKATTNWERFHEGIRQHYLYDPDDPAAENLLRDLAEREITGVEQVAGGMQLKLIITFDDGGKALCKVMRYPRETESPPDEFFFSDFERHIAEIAAFHLDRALGFNRVPPVVGRLLNMTRDIRRLADSKLARTFFVSPAGNLCFTGTCSFYCDVGHPICGHPDQLEVSLMAFLPPRQETPLLEPPNPWMRAYWSNGKAYWEVHNDLCDTVKTTPPYNSGRRLMDLIDMSVLDFLMGHQDRHHMAEFPDFGNDSILVHIDNGRGFGKSREDDLSCLAPLVQCCMVRLSTLQRLVRLYSGPTPLSDVMRRSLARDQVDPVLLLSHLQALDRRLLKVLQALVQCSLHSGRVIWDIVIDDGVY